VVLRGLVIWTRGHSQEGLRPKGAHRQIGGREFERTGTLDIRKEETLKPEIKLGKSQVVQKVVTGKE
jgi:hypothetical protein